VADDAALAAAADVPVEENVPAPLAVTGSRASYTTVEAGAPMDLPPGETVELGEGQSVTVAEDGEVSFVWPALSDQAAASVKGTLLPTSRLDVEVADGAGSRVELVQTDGAARYWVAPTDPPTDLSVTAGAVTVVADQGAADFSVQYACPEGETEGDVPLVWVVVASGETEVKGCRPPGESGSPGASQVCVVTKGRAASFTDEGVVVDIETLLPSTVETWFAGVRGGACYGPAPVVAEAPEASEDEMDVSAATPVAAVSHPAPEVSLALDHQEVVAGSCTNVRWTAANVEKVWLDGVEVADLGSEKVCPNGDMKYTLSWLGYDGTQDQATVKLRVIGGETRDEEEDDDEDEPPTAETECVGDECEPTMEPFETFAPPPTLAPTQEPAPTDEPAPTVEPTDEPEPEPTDEPAPEPTDEPAPDPTEEPAPEP
jgi:hypothetical protein